jgi:16S rRNA (guanine527-N7)-methyltransferase
MDPGCRLDDAVVSHDLTDRQFACLTRYADLIATWRNANVTGVRGRDEIWRVLVGDALSLLDVPELRRRSDEPWLDLGAGAGLPGIPLGVAVPAARLTLLEASGKKCWFLEEAVRVAGLIGRADVVRARSERFAAAREPGREAFAVVLARAVAPLPALVELAAPLLRPGGVLLASKTRRAVVDEGADGAAAAGVCGLAARPVVPLPRSPLEDAVCVVYEKVDPTPGWLPRREGLATKRPLGLAPAPATAGPGAASIDGPAKGSS